MLMHVTTIAYLESRVSSVLFILRFVFVPRFKEGKLDASSLDAYKGGLCAKAAPLGIPPAFTKSAGVSQSSSSYFGNDRPMNLFVFKQILTDQAEKPSAYLLDSAKKKSK